VFIILSSEWFDDRIYRNFITLLIHILHFYKVYHDVERYEKEIHHTHAHNLIDFKHLCRDASTAARQIIEKDKR